MNVTYSFSPTFKKPVIRFRNNEDYYDSHAYVVEYEYITMNIQKWTTEFELTQAKLARGYSSVIGDINIRKTNWENCDEDS